MWKLKLSVLLLLAGHLVAGQSLTLEQCYESARQNYPLIKQKNLIIQSREYSVANVKSGYLPQITINGQATYQSAVTAVPISVPGFEIETLSKDQYRTYAEINQTLFDGGAIGRQSAMQEVNAQLEEQNLEVELYKLKEKINQLFFGVLLLDEQRKQVDLVKKDLGSNLNKIEVAIRNGTALKSNAASLRAEILKADQRIIEMNAMRSSYLQMLGIFVNQELGESTQLQRPAVLQVTESSEIHRPELSVFGYQRELLGAQYKFSGTRNLPRVGLFLQGGYGKPALNQLMNEFDTYYIGGLRLSWSLSGFYNSKRDGQLHDISLQKVEVQKATFLFNTQLVLRQQQNEISKLEDLVRVDDEIITLRTEVKNTAQAQLESGVITTNDYLQELNAEDQAVQNKLLHEIQLLMALYNYKTTSGN
jgi:outer membrane protein TolC